MSYDAPFAGTRLTVSKSRLVSYSHNSDPSFVDHPRTPPWRVTTSPTPIASLATRSRPSRSRANVKGSPKGLRRSPL